MHVARQTTARTEDTRAADAPAVAWHLVERLKELNCLYDIADLEQRPGIPLEEVIQGIVDLLPPAMQFPEIAGARATLGNREYASAGFRETAWKMGRDITVSGQAAGRLEVCYLPDRPRGGGEAFLEGPFTEGPFLKGEQRLLDAVTERVGRIIERMRAEEALRDSEERYRDLFENATDLVQSVSPDGRFVYVNRAWRETFGYSDDEIPNITMFDVIHPDCHAHCLEVFRRLMAGEKADKVEALFVAKDGRTIEVEGNADCRLVDGKPVYTRGIFRDITERKRMEEALREREAILRQAQQLAHLGSWEWNLVDGSFRMSEEMRRIYGLQDTDLLPNIQSVIESMIHPDDLEIVTEAAKGVTEGQSGKPLVYRIVRPTGEVRWIAATRPEARRADQNGNPMVFVGAVQDVTQRKQADEQLQRYAAELERANEEVKQFAYIVSHDLRAPLVNLKGFAAELRSAFDVVVAAANAALPGLEESQRRDVTMAIEEDVPEALGFIDSSTSHMDHFIGAVLKLSRLGRRDLHPEVVDMEALTSAALASLAHQIEERQAQVTMGYLPLVVADRTAMEQIMGNILGNAVKYLDPDRPGTIDISAKKDHDEVTFCVRDNGRGISAEDMPKVFAPFRRAGAQDVPGDGMGLPYVQTLVRHHGGRIWCESELGVGSTFAFALPLPSHAKERS